MEIDWFSVSIRALISSGVLCTTGVVILVLCRMDGEESAPIYAKVERVTGIMLVAFIAALLATIWTY